MVTDWRGDRAMVDAPEAVALYPAGRVIGDLLKPSNLRNVHYLRRIGRDVDTCLKQMRYDGEVHLESDHWSY